MGQKRYPIDKEVEITILVRVNLQQISNYSALTSDQVDAEILEAESQLSQFLKDKLISAKYEHQELTQTVDWWTFEVN